MLKAIAVALGVMMIAAAVSHSWPASASGSFDKKACTFNGKKLYGDIRAVTSGADVDVRVVTSGADLDVRKVTSGASSCGEWRMVTSGADTDVRFVNSGADLDIRYVTSAPGVP